jgi:hypothetical protein
MEGVQRDAGEGSWAATIPPFRGRGLEPQFPEAFFDVFEVELE